MKVTRRKVASGSRYVPFVRSAFRVARGAYNAYNRYKTSTSRRSTEVQPLTGEKDVRVTYIKRRMPKRKKRQYVKSVKRYKNHLYRSLPGRVFVKGFCQTYTSAVNCSQYFGIMAGLTGQNCYDNHLNQCFEVIASGSPNKVAAGHIRLDHMSLSVVLYNPSVVNVDIDIYKVMCIKDIPFSDWTQTTQIQSMHTVKKNLLRQASGMDIEVNDAGGGIGTLIQNAGSSSATQVVGDTLWNAPPFLRYWKILKQSKIHLPPGGTAQFQLRTSKNYNVTRDNCLHLAAKAFLTQGYIFNINGRWNETEGFIPATLTMESFVRYNVKCIPGNSPTLVYDAAA